jgi:uncharacterized protein (TIGR04255 family)
MTTLANAPLLEAFFEIRWGNYKIDPVSKGRELVFSRDEIDFFFGKFRTIAESIGLSHVERVIPEEAPPFPHLVCFRFRKLPNTWPCYQIGLGVFTANQVNDGYSWKAFKQDILNGIDYLDRGHPLGLEKLPLIRMELRYRDSLLFKEGESPIDFLNKNMEIKLNLRKEFLESDFLSYPISGTKLSFNLRTLKPEGTLIINLNQGTINARPGFIMDTITRCGRNDIDKLNKAFINHWLEETHDIQRHAFSNLINPIFARSFQ